MKSLALAAMVLAACAHTEDPGLRGFAPIPAGATAITLTRPDGAQLAQLVWRPAGEPRASIVLVHGLRDHATRYAAFATRLVAAGYAVYAADLRGHAHSAGPRVDPTAWRDYVTDLDAVVAQVPTTHPVFVLGHSMGGTIATLWTIEHPGRSAGLILSAPALAIDRVPLAIAATRLFALLTPRASALDLPTRDFSSDAAVIEAMRTDPMVMQTPAPARTAAGLLAGMRAIWVGAGSLRLPLLALHGARDKITAPAGSRALVERAASSDRTLRIYDNMVHDLLHEPGGAHVADDIIAWLDAHTGGPAIAARPMYTGRLRGEPGEWTQALGLAAGVTQAGRFAGLATLQLGKQRPVGWHGGVTGYLLGDTRALSVRPLGLAVRHGGAALGIAGGGALTTGARGATSFAAFAELPAGPLHLSLLAERERQIENTHLHGPLASDQLLTAVSVRLGADRAYWPGAVAGVGPVVTGGLVWMAEDAAAWFVTVGVQLYGAD